MEPIERRRALVRLVLAAAVFAVATAAVSDQTYLWGEAGTVEVFNDLPTAVGWPFRVVMQLGTVWVALVVAAVVTWPPRRRSWLPATAALVAIAVAYRLDNVIKAVVDRPRPPLLLDGLVIREHIDGFGFPSGHTTMACALAGALHPVVPSRWRPLLWVLAALVALTRMHVGVHWPMDLVGGAALGVAIAAATWLGADTVARALTRPK